MNRRIIYMLLFVLLAFMGCKKRKEKNIQPSKDFALIANDLYSVVPLVKNIALNASRLKEIILLGKDSLNTCASITLVSGDTLNISNSSPLTFDVNFSTGCLDNDLIVKKGIIRCTIYGPMSNSGANGTCKFIGFEIGGNSLTGIISITNLGSLTYLVSTSNLRLQVGEKYIYYDTETRMLQIGGDNTPDNSLDDSYVISSESKLTDRYEKEVKIFAEELYKLYSCRWITGGYAELIDDDNKVQIIDFGERSCDNSAEISIEEKVYTIDLP